MFLMSLYNISKGRRIPFFRIVLRKLKFKKKKDFNSQSINITKQCNISIFAINKYQNYLLITDYNNIKYLKKIFLVFTLIEKINYWC